MTNEQNELNFDAPTANAGFRLQYLEVLNWGTFHKKCWRIEPNGYNSLLTGDIGSGKSTLVDALTTLMVPHQKIVYNKAAGAESKERNLLSYVRGEFKKEKEEITKAARKVYLRPEDNTYSVIIAGFYNGGYNEHVCLAQVFWIKDGKVEKLLLTATQPLSVKSHFSGFGDINDLRRRLRNDKNVSLFEDNFSRYSEYFRHRFGMNSDKAIDLFYQTVSMKSVSSLTGFVREQMLERTDIKEQVAALLKRFDDLNKAHAAVVHAREQYGILKPLVEHAVEYGETTREIERLEQMLLVLPVWFALQKQELLNKATADTEQELQTASQNLLIIRDELAALDSRKFGLMQDIENTGGRRLDQIGEELKRREEAKATKKKAWEAYETLAKRCGLQSAQSESAFTDNIQKAKERADACVEKEQGLRKEWGRINTDLRGNENELKEEEKELASLQERQTQVPAWLIGFRRQLCTDLRIEEEELPFAGELLKVLDEESDWEGALERLLHDLGISLLVPANHYRGVSRYVNANTLRSADGRGIKLTYLEAATDKKDAYLKQLTADSVVNKLEIKPDTPFYTWLEGFLHRNFGDFACVDVEELQLISFGITKQGLIKSGKVRHIKDDRKLLTDRRNYVLGWSNKEKIKTLEEAIRQLKAGREQLRKALVAIEKEERENTQVKEAIGFLLHVEEYAAINWHYEVEKIHELAMEQKELLENNDLLKTLQQKLEEVKEVIRQTKEKETDKNQLIGKLKERINDYNKQFTATGELIRGSDAEKQQKHFPFIEEKLPARNFRLTNIDAQQEQFRKLFEGETGELKKLRTKQTRLSNQIVEKMRDIKEHSKAEYSELSTDIEARGEYTDKFNRLVKEDLKRHEERFKEELNRNTINSIAVFDSQLNKHEKDIRQKIGNINQHLREIVYDAAKGTYITLQMDASTNAQIRQFREDLRRCYMHSLSGNSNLYTEDKYEQVKKILDRFASADPAEKEWTATVTDVRQWFEFNASERYEAGDEEKEFYEGSGGKSGGQKEKLAYTILASALAYQFGLQFGENRSRSFRFVVIDEAFGRGSDESTRYGLELFKKLNLQLLIVTPLQKIHIIESHVNSFHFVSNRDGNNSQISNFTIEQYLEEKAAHNSLFRKDDAVSNVV